MSTHTVELPAPSPDPHQVKLTSFEQVASPDERCIISTGSIKIVQAQPANNDPDSRYPR